MTKRLPRVAAVHDISGYGKCALTIAIPVISAAGIEVCPVPTALFSANTSIEGFTFFDFTPYIDEYIDHWQKLDLKFDCVYSGFLGSVKQIDTVTRLIRDFTSGISVIDPVMGDQGLLFKTYTPDMCRELARLVAIADYVTPNVTEGCILTGRKYKGAELDEKESREICREITAMGTKNVVLTGVVRKDKLFNCGMEKDKGYFEEEIDRLPFNMHGTGDLFSSVMVAGLVRGYSLAESVASAARFVFDAMSYSKDIEDAFERGVAFEPLVYKIGEGIYRS